MSHLVVNAMNFAKQQQQITKELRMDHTASFPGINEWKTGPQIDWVCDAGGPHQDPACMRYVSEHEIALRQQDNLNSTLAARTGEPLTHVERQHHHNRAVCSDSAAWSEGFQRVRCPGYGQGMPGTELIPSVNELLSRTPEHAKMYREASELASQRHESEKRTAERLVAEQHAADQQAVEQWIAEQ